MKPAAWTRRANLQVVDLLAVRDGRFENAHALRCPQADVRGIGVGLFEHGRAELLSGEGGDCVAFPDAGPFSFSGTRHDTHSDTTRAPLEPNLYRRAAE